jgi:uncharacterized repeat protein (TIGR03806 family)
MRRNVGWPAIPLFLVLCASPAMAALYGLDERPGNPDCVAGDRPQSPSIVGLQRVFRNVPLKTLPDVPDEFYRNGPIELAQIPGDSSHWYEAERAGRLLRFVNEDAVATTAIFLDLTSRFVPIDYFPEWGITSFAFHPDFRSNGELYVVYNVKPGAEAPVESRLSRFRSTDGGVTSDPATEQILISFTQEVGKEYHPFAHVAFGPDGYLYLSSGDGLTNELAQDPFDLRGKILRIDVDQGDPYAIPPTNPYAGGGGAPEVYARGFRNPWRFSFDHVTGDLWVGDVGAEHWEEINLVQNGGNYGWNTMEGPFCLLEPCDSTGMLPPFVYYSHQIGNSVTGGYVYRGSDIPELQGSYLFADAGVGRMLWIIGYADDGTPYQDVLLDTGDRASAFARDNDGELYLFDVRQQEGGGIFRIVPAIRDGSLTGGPAERLSQTGCVRPAAPTQPAPGLIPYDVLTPLWSDGALKRRWMGLPDGTRIAITPDGDFEFPIGTVLMKSFYHDGVPIETRLFMRHTDGSWAGYSYEWREDRSDADLLPADKVKLVGGDLLWTYPSRPQCLQCHTEAAGYTLGPELLQLNSDFLYPETGRTSNQLRTLEHIGLFEHALPAPPNALRALVPVDRPNGSDILQARSYLHANCSICHRPGGEPHTPIDFRFTAYVETMSVCNELPLHGDLEIPGALVLKPGDPSLSLVSLRPSRLDVNRMPPIGTRVVDSEGTAAIDAWIERADVCGRSVDRDRDGTMDAADNCTLVSNPDQRDSDQDGYGNACDPDFDNDGIVNFSDLGVMKRAFFGDDQPVADLDGDGLVNFTDLAIMKQSFFGSPGPSSQAP